MPHYTQHCCDTGHSLLACYPKWNSRATLLPILPYLVFSGNTCQQGCYALAQALHVSWQHKRNENMLGCDHARRERFGFFTLWVFLGSSLKEDCL